MTAEEIARSAPEFSDQLRAAGIAIGAEIEGHVVLLRDSLANYPNSSLGRTAYVKERQRLWEVALAAVRKTAR